ncbi:quinone-dependent dihydroorotate dehydrogenase [Thermaurantiacus sp.]
MWSALQPLARLLPPETAHGLAIRSLELAGGPLAPPPDPRLEARIGTLVFPSPIGLAAGFDKDARVWRQMLAAGFGFVEVGTLTPRPQAGNPRPRLFRLPAERAVINRLGFNNGGLAAALPRLVPDPRLGVNLGANRDSRDWIADYRAGVAAVRDRAAFITLNISSPNTAGLRELQGQALPDLLAAVAQTRGPDGPPLWLKVAPDLDDRAIAFISRTVLAADIGALVVANTTVARPPGLRGRHAGEAGGLSGRPLFGPSTEVLRRFARELGGRVPLVGVGGVASAADVVAKLKAGASAVQLYTALAYQGIGLPRRLNRELVALLDAEGVRSPAELVGRDVARA